MIDRHEIRVVAATARRDERSMRVVEYALALLALASAVLMAVR